MIYACCDDRRRAAILRHPSLNGIDFLEVQDDPGMPADQRQRSLALTFIKELTPGALNRTNVRIEGGERVREIAVIATGAGPSANVLLVRVDQPGDFSTYTLRLVKSAANADPPTNIDPRLATVDFSFKVNCPTDFDCDAPATSGSTADLAPEIDYLAKDFASFRRLMLDRLARLRPNDQPPHQAGIEMGLVELLAYVGDYLSYRQDAVATEAYLDTARLRVSARRHARLMDYLMHDGCNARAWVQIQVAADILRLQPTDPPVLPASTRLLTSAPGQPLRIDPGSADEREALASGAEVFETIGDVDDLVAAHAELQFYTWGARECCLPAGAVAATLRGDFPRLRVGAVLVFQELIGAATGDPADADPARRHAVRLTRVTPDSDPLGALLDDPDAADPTPLAVTEIEWGHEDALPFALCVSAETARGYRENISVARGNIALADHGATVRGEQLRDETDRVPPATLFRVVPATGGCARVPPTPVPARFRPRLQQSQLSYAAPPPLPGSSAAAALRWQTFEAAPSAQIEDSDGFTWRPRRDLLGADRFGRAFVVEVEDGGTARIRFGDDKYGKRPAPGLAFIATYRVGNGVRGNVGAAAITHIITDQDTIVGIENPLPARGGVEPERIEEVRLHAPFAYRTQERAVTAADYAEVARRFPGVQRAAATFRWTGSWRTVFLTIDRLGGLPVDSDFERDMRRHLERYRLAGQDVEVDGPRFVPLEIVLRVCIAPDYFRSHVREALDDLFSNRTLPGGRRGLFHPDNFSFGQPVYVSPLIAAAQATDGVVSVTAVRFGHQGSSDISALSQGMLALGRLEIAQLDNDPNFPEHGVFRLVLDGGK